MLIEPNQYPTKVKTPMTTHSLQLNGIRTLAKNVPPSPMVKNVPPIPLVKNVPPIPTNWQQVPVIKGMTWTRNDHVRRTTGNIRVRFRVRKQFCSIFRIPVWEKIFHRATKRKQMDLYTRDVQLSILSQKWFKNANTTTRRTLVE